LYQPLSEAEAMDQNWPHAVVVANDWDGPKALPPARRRRFALELDRNGLFLTVGRTDLYVCMEPSASWALQREAGDLELRAWRLHLILGRAPKTAAA
jgi:hypothetical protein